MLITEVCVRTVDWLKLRQLACTTYLIAHFSARFLDFHPPPPFGKIGGRPNAQGSLNVALCILLDFVDRGIKPSASLLLFSVDGSFDNSELILLLNVRWTITSMIESIVELKAGFITCSSVEVYTLCRWCLLLICRRIHIDIVPGLSTSWWSSSTWLSMDSCSNVLKLLFDPS